MENVLPAQTEVDQAAKEIFVDSATLLRLIEEVRNEEINTGRHYDRVHNRHNR